MKLNVYSVYDIKAAKFMRPYYEETHGQAIRSFSGACQEPSSHLNSYPEDFKLFHVGMFDQEVGTFENLKTPPQYLAAAVDFIKKDFKPSIENQGIQPLIK